MTPEDYKLLSDATPQWLKDGHGLRGAQVPAVLAEPVRTPPRYPDIGQGKLMEVLPG